MEQNPLTRTSLNRQKTAFDYIKINLASPKRIREWSERILPNGQIVGEITTSDTLNYRSLKPEMGGLFCERIFGPQKSWECSCGKYKHIRRPISSICEVCNVEVTESIVRRHRMGYIELLAPTTHIWYLKGRPSYLSYVLENVKEEEEFYDEEGKKEVNFKYTVKNLEKIIYSRQNNEPKDEESTVRSFSADEAELYLEANENREEEDEEDDEEDIYSEKKRRTIETIYNSLKNINLNELVKNLRAELYSKKTKPELQQKKQVKVIRVLESFLATDSDPVWMMLTVLPVIPPALRPLMELNTGRLASSDLNDLYRKIIIRNHRLERLYFIYAPENVIRSEKRLLQESVDALIDNGKRGAAVVDANNRPLKSLAQTVKGKQGRFRQNLLGKRVDYSGRSVIIVGPNLQLNQCGIPFELGIKLLKPFLIQRLIDYNFSGTITTAKQIINRKDSFIWNLLYSVSKEHSVLLNRAPTLHRLGIQAFEPIIIRGSAIQLHPLVCSAFNADFDGDQMAVHIPLSPEAQVEAKLLLFAPNNFLSTSGGQPSLQPTQDMILGFYYLTTTSYTNLTGSNHYFGSFKDVLLAYENKQLKTHSFIWVRCPQDFKIMGQLNFIRTISLDDKSTIKFYDNLQVRYSKNNKIIVKYVRTTPGRIIFNNTLNSILTV